MSRRMFTCPFDTSKYRSSATDAEAARIDFVRANRAIRSVDLLASSSYSRDSRPI